MGAKVNKAQKEINFEASPELASLKKLRKSRGSLLTKSMRLGLREVDLESVKLHQFRSGVIRKNQLLPKTVMKNFEKKLLGNECESFLSKERTCRTKLKTTPLSQD